MPVNEVRQLVLKLEARRENLIDRWQTPLHKLVLPEGLKLPSDAAEFWSAVKRGDFEWAPLKFFFLEKPFEKSINERFIDEVYDQTYPYFERCFAFAGSEGPSFYFGIDLNEGDRHGSVFGYEDELMGVSKTAYYLYPSFLQWLRDCVSVTPHADSIFTTGDADPVL